MSYTHRLLNIKCCKPLSYWAKQRHIQGAFGRVGLGSLVLKMNCIRCIVLIKK